MNRPKSVPRHAGFTLIELLVVMLVAMVLLTLSAPELMKYYIRSQLEGLAREASITMQRARYQAIRSSQDVQVCANAADRVITAPGASLDLPDSVSFGAPPSFDAIDIKAPGGGNCFTFRPDGSVQYGGAFRIQDVRGNFLEIQVGPVATARVQVRKWDETESDWYTREQGGKAWEWKTGNLL
jgi:prepilin-type N-terminal cleavage/methylation domain-containing protein